MVVFVGVVVVVAAAVVVGFIFACLLACYHVVLVDVCVLAIMFALFVCLCC